MSAGKAWAAFGWSAVALALAPPVAAKSLEMEGRAAAAATVTRGQARFTVLTSGLIRMEWSPAARFVDAPSQVFIDRDQPVPRFTTTVENGKLVIRTEALELSYTLDSGRLTATNLTIRSRNLKPAFSWRPGTSATGNLHGTARTLDRYSGDRQIDNGNRLDLGQGLISRDGWHVVDDSRRLCSTTAARILGSRNAPVANARTCISSATGTITPLHSAIMPRLPAASRCPTLRFRLLVVALLELFRPRVARSGR